MISKPSKSSKIFSFQHFSMTNEASYDDLERILGSPKKNFLFPNKIAIFSYPGSIVILNKLIVCCAWKNRIFIGKMQCSPTMKSQGVPTLPPTKKYFLTTLSIIFQTSMLCILTSKWVLCIHCWVTKMLNL